MKSLPTIIQESNLEKNNHKQYTEFIRKLNPELYLIHIALTETSVNPLIVPHIIRSLGNLALGTGFGEITIIVRDGTIEQIRGYESTVLKEKVTIDRT